MSYEGPVSQRKRQVNSWRWEWFRRKSMIESASSELKIRDDSRKFIAFFLPTNLDNLLVPSTIPNCNPGIRKVVSGEATLC